ncbi:MAG: NAD(P)/FAD-dependent oxidoreductase [Deltaproteobacteria bacterium]|nr:NAD(P)/FAD-dependent oxidoreductase [Deltaproteobacteria bacterium]
MSRWHIFFNAVVFPRVFSGYNKQMTRRDSIVVIGAGVGGLVCATILAKAGFGVSLIEQNNKVGGLSQGWERKIRLANGERVRATFDLTHLMSQFLPGEHFYELYTSLGVDWETVGAFIPTSKIACLRAPSGEFFEILNGFEESRAQLKQLYPRESVNIDRYFQLLDNIDEQFQAPPHRRPGWQRTLETLLAPGCEKYLPLNAMLSLLTKPHFVKWHKHTQQQLVDAFFKDDQLKTHLSLIADYMGLPPSRASGLMMCLVVLSFWKHGGPSVPKRSSYQTLHNELARVLVEKHGGTVHLGTKAIDITVEKNRVKGVSIQAYRRGTELRFLVASTVVVAGDMKKILLPLADRLPKKYVQKLSRMKMATSFLTVHMVVERDKLPLNDSHGVYGTTMVVSSPSALEIEQSKEFPKKYNIIVSFPGLVRPQAPHVSTLDGQPLNKYLRMDLSMKCPSYEKLAILRQSDKPAYKALKEKTVMQMIDIVEAHFLPGLKDALQYKLSFTAATMERYCSVTQGAVYGFEQTPNQFPPYRMSPWTPIKGLYATGAGTLAGGIAGVIAAGERTANIVIRERGRGM